MLDPNKPSKWWIMTGNINNIYIFFFSGLISTTNSEVFIAVRIAYISFLHCSAHIWFSYISCHYSPLGRFIWIQHYDQLPVGLLAQLVEHCTGIVEVQIPYGPEFFSGLISTTSSVMFVAARIAYILLIVIFKLMVLKLTFSVSGII